MHLQKIPKYPIDWSFNFKSPGSLILLGHELHCTVRSVVILDHIRRKVYIKKNF